MTRRATRRSVEGAVLLIAAAALAGCGAADRIANIGKTPDLSSIDGQVKEAAHKPVSMPMPPPQSAKNQANSIWRQGSRAFFKDQRASQVGDIVTVVVAIDEKAEISNSTTRTRNNSNTASLNNFLGYENSLDKILPEGVSGPSLVDLGSTLSNSGSGIVDREEEITFSVAAIVTQKLPNGNMVVVGKQEIRVNFEVREILVAGVIRAEDISATNTVSWDKLAEARIAYGGRGQLTDVQQPRYGDQVLDILLPF